MKNLLQTLLFLSYSVYLSGQINLEYDCNQYQNAEISEDSLDVLLSTFRENFSIEELHNTATKIYCLSVASNLQKGKAFALNKLGFYHYSLSEHMQALNALKEANEISERINYPKGKADYNCYMGLVNESLNHRDIALNHYTALESLGNKHNNKQWYGDAKVNIGSVHLNGGNYTDAIKYLNDGINILQNSKHEYGLGWAYAHLASVYKTLDNQDKAQQYYYKAYTAWESQNHGRGLCYLYGELGQFYSKSKRDSSYTYHEKAINCDQGIIPTVQYSSSNYHLGLLYREDGNLQTALEYFKKSFEYGDKNNLTEILDLTSMEMANIYEVLKMPQKQLKYLHLNEQYKRERLKQSNEEFANWLARDKEFRQLEIDNIKKDFDSKLQAKTNNLLKIGLVILILLTLILSYLLWHRLKTSKWLSKVNNQLNDNLATIQVQSEKLKQTNQQLNAKQSELSTQLINKLAIISNNQKAMESLKEKVKSLNLDPKVNSTLMKEIKSRHNQDLLDKVGKELADVNSSLFSTILKKHPSLTSNNLKLVSYIKMNLSNKEIADLQFISESSVKMAKNRLKKKLSLDAQDSLTAYIHGY